MAMCNNGNLHHKMDKISELAFSIQYRNDASIFKYLLFTYPYKLIILFDPDYSVFCGEQVVTLERHSWIIHGLLIQRCSQVLHVGFF